MTLASSYLVESVTLKTRTGVNDRNEATYSSGSVMAHVQGYEGLVRTREAEEVVCSFKVWTDSTVNEGDVMQLFGREYPVLRVENWTPFGQDEPFYVAYL